MHERTRQRDALPLPTRVRAHRTVREASEVEPRAGALDRRRHVAPMQSRGHLDVLDAREIRIAERLVPEPAELATDARAGGREGGVVDRATRGSRERPQDA